MLSKLDVRSSRVKGITFHKQRPWVLCGLHNGVVQIWDYSMNTSVDTFYISNGGVPTRGVDFHESQPLFVTGSDDHLVRVWNYKLRRCMYTLAGHVDYIRTTFFHHNQPWILSSSDDYIIRIWNWQSRACIAMLPGHLHYVMCAQFHPTQPLVASASLDKTIKVWDISKLQFRKQEAGVVQDLLGTSDVEVKYTLEGHEKAVNWVSFHPTHSYLVSASDDRTVRVWSYSDSGFYNETTLRGHTHNVCCATYFKGKYIISCGEDRVIKVFAVGGNSTAIMTFRRELDRYWILATYASKNLIAAGHDTGLQVFKLFRERPPFAVSQNQLTYIHENQLFVYDFKSESDTKFNLPGKMLRPPYALSVNPSASQIVVCLKDDSNYVDLIDIPKAGFSASLKAPNRKTDVTEATFFGPNKYVYIDANGGLFMHSLTGEKDKSLGVPFVCTKLFPAPTGCVLCQSEENIYIYQVAQHASIAEAPAVGTRQAVWDKGFHKVALLSKNAIEIRTKRLKLITTVRELTSRIKSAVFDETRDVLFYTTSNHIKYCILRTGEVSTICTLKTVVYLVAAVGDKVWMLTRSGKVLVKELDNLELNFKLKLQQQSFREVMKIIQSRELKGQALVGYLHKHNYSEIALHFAKEPLTRFNLALECGAIDIAKEAAMELDDASVWRRLSETAITFGDIQLSQLADSKANNYHASAMHMLYTGNLSALGHLVDSVQDDNFKLQYGLYLNDYEQRIQLLLNANQLPLAYLTAKSNGLEEVAANIYSKMSDEVKKNIDQTECPKSDPSPKPTPQTDNWPMLQVEESIFTKLLKQTGELDVLAANVEELDDDAADAWGDGDDDDLFKEMDEEGDSPLQGAPEEAEGDGWDDDLDIDVNAVLKSAAGTKSDAGFVVPPALPPISTHWVETSTVAAFHVAAGQFTSAFHLLKGQIGLKDPAPLKKEALLLWSSVNVSRPAWLTSSVSFSLTAAGSSATNSKHIPRVPNYMPHLLDTLKSGYQAFTDGRFDDAHALFRSILHKCVFTVVSNDQELASFRDLLSVAAEYTRALAVQLQLRSSEASSQEALELSLYLTHFQLQRPHMILGLSQAMSKAYKRKNFRTAASVARRLVDLDPPEKRAKQAAAIIAEADKNPVDADELKYDERNPFTLCSESYTPIYKGTLAVVRCGYCLSGVAPTHDGKVCGVCGVSSYGAQCAGLINQV